ncbi:DUF2169 domain-containing protein [Sorangium sp. So ce1036]|uniref:DUF2169 family type VI secretion system accessory protein n=1 Tax=Sorangium TaxID=39643 RepID=UPI001F5C561C|nr:DUF2169 domain-containing protein [Sorangium cellulosum]
MSDSFLVADAVTPLHGTAATAVAWRSRGQLRVTVIAKATFAFAPDAAMPRAAPQPILRAEVHHGDHPARSVRFTSDLAPCLARADVLFTGHAWAPAERPVDALTVRLAVFDGRRPLVDKRLVVREQGGFLRAPIVYERAVCRADRMDNPLGVAPGAGAPGVLDPAAPDRPAGFGPIARAWPARRRRLGPTPRKALEGPIAEIPDGFDWSYFQAAPPDQQTELLRGDEWIVLEGLSPGRPLLRMRLPAARGIACVHGLSAFGMPEGQPLDLRADTLRIDGDEQRCTLVFRGSFPVAGEAALAAVRIAAGVASAGTPLAWVEPRAPRRAATAPEPARAQGPTGTVSMAPPESHAAPSSGGALSSGGAPSAQDATLWLDHEEAAASGQGPALPFSSAAPASSAPPPSASSASIEQAGGASAPPATLALAPDDEPSPPGHAALPFVAAAAPSPPLAAPPPASSPLPGAPWSAQRAPAAPAPCAGPGTLILALDACELPWPPLPAASPQEVDLPAPPPVQDEGGKSGASRFYPDLRRPWTDRAGGAEEAPPSLASAPDREEISLERCAAIAAELAERRAPRSEVLAAHGLSAARWREVEQRWEDAMDREQRRGDRSLRDRFDAAYIAAWESLRGPLEVAGYARLMLAHEHRELDAALDALAIRRTVWVRVRRLWSKRLADSPALAAAVKERMAALRGA